MRSPVCGGLVGGRVGKVESGGGRSRERVKKRIGGLGLWEKEGGQVG